MPELITKTQRWLDLIAVLLGCNVPLAVEEIMERVPAYAQAYATGDNKARASARRMFERDKDELRAAGFPIETVRYAINYGTEQMDGYRISRGDFYLPYLRLLSDAPDAAAPRSKSYPGVPTLELDPREAEQALDALRRVSQLPAFPFAAEGRSALRKLTFDVDPDRFTHAAVRWVDRPGAEEVLDRLQTLSDALLARKRVRFVYRGIQRDETTEREVAPYGIFFQKHWYLVGHDFTRDAVRVFRVGRAEEIKANSKSPKEPDYEVPPDFRLPDYLNRSAWELGEKSVGSGAEVRFHFPLSLWAARNGLGILLREEEDGSALRQFSVSQTHPFLRWILSLGTAAELLGPPQMCGEYNEMVRETAALYAEPGGCG